MTLAFKVEGTPAPQGSKTGRSYCGQAAKTCQNCRKPHLVNINMVESSAGVKPWRAQVAAKARFAAGASWEPLAGPVSVEVTFILKRPKGHYRTGRFAGLLKDSAPAFPHESKGMDADKLARAVLDALTGIAYADDRQVVRLVAQKLYGGPECADPGYHHPGAYVTVTPRY